MNLESAMQIKENQLTVEEVLILSDLEKLSQIVIQRGYPCRAYSPKSLITLSQLTLDRKQLLAQQIQNVLKIVASAPETEISDQEHPEKKLVEQALEMNGLELRDDYWNLLEKDDVIELYNTENIQLFRTFNFFKISSYSLLDLLTNEWYHLWERPSFILDELIKVSVDMFQGKTLKPTLVAVSRHILKEIYNDSSIHFKNSSVLVEPGYICPLYGKNSKDIKGFIFSLRGIVMGYDEEANKIALI